MDVNFVFLALAMAKIHITGNSGAGKTTFANRLGQVLDLPVFGLDNVVWQPGWKATPKALRERKERELIDQSEWIIEGVSKQIRRAADVVIFLDVSRGTSFRRSFGRNLRYLFRSRPGLPSRCPEILLLPKQIGIVWNFKRHSRPRILDDLNEHPGKTYIVNEQTDLEQFATQIAAYLKGLE